LNYGEAGKSTSQDAFRIELQKNKISKRIQEKAGTLDLAFGFFQKQNHFKSQIKHPLVSVEVAWSRMLHAASVALVRSERPSQSLI
jgi:hypothetical protein